MNVIGGKSFYSYISIITWSIIQFSNLFLKIIIRIGSILFQTFVLYACDPLWDRISVVIEHIHKYIKFHCNIIGFDIPSMDVHP